MDFNYTLSNMFAVSQSQVKLEILPGQDSVSARIPIVLTEPLSVSQLELVLAKSLRELSIKLDTDGDGSHVRIIAKRESVASGTLTGSVGLRLKGTDDSDGFFLTVGLRSPITVSPDTLQLTVLEDRKALVGNAVLQIALEKDSPAHEIQPEVSLAVGDQKAEIRVTRIGESRNYRLQFECEVPTGLAKDKPIALTWQVVVGKEKREFKSQAFLAK